MTARTTRRQPIKKQKQQHERKMKIKGTITENGNGLPSIGEICYDARADTVYTIIAWDGSDCIHVHGHGRGNSVNVLLEKRGSASDITEAEWESIQRNNYGVVVDDIATLDLHR